jgi:hypothetical protein
VRGTLTAVKYPLILGFGILRRSTDHVLVVVSFSQREKDLALYVAGKTYGKTYLMEY